MLFLDVNVLLYAYSATSPRHTEYAAWLQKVFAAERPIAVTSSVLSGFVRIATNPKIFQPPSSIHQALTFTTRLLEHPLCVRLEPGDAHWSIFTRLCREVGATGNLIPDTYLAALAIEHDCELISTDRDFARFTGLKWRHPLEG